MKLKKPTPNIVLYLKIVKKIYKKDNNTIS